MKNTNKTTNFSPTAQQPNSPTAQQPNSPTLSTEPKSVFFLFRLVLITLLLSYLPSSQANAQFCPGSFADVSQTDVSASIATLGTTSDLAQSFEPNTSPIGGVRVNFGGGTYPVDAYIELYTGGVPPAGTLLGTTNTVTATSTGWVDFPFPSFIAVTPGNPHHIRFLKAGGAGTANISGSTTNPYPDGQVYGTSGFGSFPSFDYAFEIIASPNPCPSTSSGIPTLSEWGLIILALLLLTLGTLYLVQPNWRDDRSSVAEP